MCDLPRCREKSEKQLVDVVGCAALVREMPFAFSHLSILCSSSARKTQDYIVPSSQDFPGTPDQPVELTVVFQIGSCFKGGRGGNRSL